MFGRCWGIDGILKVGAEELWVRERKQFNKEEIGMVWSMFNYGSACLGCGFRLMNTENSVNCAKMRGYREYPRSIRIKGDAGGPESPGVSHRGLVK